MIYNKVTGKVYTQEEYIKLVSEKSQEVNDIEDVRGTKAYFDGYKETEAILTNATSKFLFKQNPQHEDYIRSATELTDSQIRKLFQIGGDPDDDNDEHKGECCLIDNNKCVFLKVDYLSSERYIVETNVENLQKMYA